MGGEQVADSPVGGTEPLSSNQTVDRHFKDAVNQYIKTNWGTWVKGESMGQCLILQAGSITKEAKEAVIEYGVDEAFDKLSGKHLQSLSTAWKLCVSKTEVASVSSSDK